jgi:hypothetical protein
VRLSRVNQKSGPDTCLVYFREMGNSRRTPMMCEHIISGDQKRYQLKHDYTIMFQQDTKQEEVKDTSVDKIIL